MAAIILTGDDEKKLAYIDKFIEENKIPSYYITRFADPLKIAQVKEIIKSLSSKIEEGKSRLYIIEQTPTTEAQNALLKSIEEIEDNSTLIFISEFLLPTIYSRSRIVNLGIAEKQIFSEEEKDLVKHFLKNDDHTTSSSLMFIDKFFSLKLENPIQQLILLLRDEMLVDFKSSNSKSLGFNYLLVKKLFKIYPLVKTNNLNARIACERIFLSLT